MLVILNLLVVVVQVVAALLQERGRQEAWTASVTPWPFSVLKATSIASLHDG